MSRPIAQHPQDWRFVMALFSVSTFLELSAWGHMLAFTPLYLKNELNVSPEEIPRWVGILASSSLVVAVPLSPFWGVLADRYSRKAVILRSLGVQCLCYGAVALSTTVGQFLGARLLFGLAFGDTAVVMATQSIVTPIRSLGTALGIILMVSTVGSSLGPLLGSLIINTLGLRAMFAVDAGLALTAALLVGLLFREPDIHDRSTPVLEKLKVVLGQIATVPPIRWNFLCWFLVFVGVAAIDPYLPVLIDRLSGPADSATAIGALLAGYGLLTALGTPLAGRLADRMGAAPLFMVAAPMLAVIAGGMGLVASLPLLALLVLLRAGPQSGTTVVLYSHLATHVPVRHRSAVMGLVPMPRHTAWLVGPVLASVASGYGLSGAFWFAAALYGGASLVALLMVRASGPRQGFDPDAAS